MIAALLAVATSGYPVCVVTETAGDPEVTCYDAQNDAQLWRFCSDKEGSPPGGLFTNYDGPFRFVGRPSCPETTCPPVVTGRAIRKEVVRNANGVAIATGLIAVSGEFADDFEPLDRFNTSSCTSIAVVQ